MGPTAGVAVQKSKTLAPVANQSPISPVQSTVQFLSAVICVLPQFCNNKFVLNRQRNYFPGKKRLGREINHSSPSIAKVLTEKSYKSSPSKSIQGMERGKLTFTVWHGSLYSDSHAYVSSRWRPHNNYSNTITHRVLQVSPTALNFTDITWIYATLYISLREH